MEINKTIATNDKQHTNAERLQLHASSLLAQDESAIGGFCSGILDGAINQPLAAIKQICANGKTKENLPSLDINNENSSHKVGEIIGSFVPFAIVGEITKGASNRLLGEAANPSLCRIMGEHASTGFIMGSVLNTSKLKPGESLLSARLNQGACSAITFASMSGSASMLESSLPKAKTLGLLAARSLGIAGTSGAIGGAIDAELKTGFKAKKEEVLNSAVGFAGFGILMEAGGLALAPRSLREPSSNISGRDAASLVMGTRASAASAGWRGEARDPGAPHFAKTRDPGLAETSGSRLAETSGSRLAETSGSRLAETRGSRLAETRALQEANEHESTRKQNASAIDLDEPRIKTPESNDSVNDFSIAKLNNKTLPFAREQLLREFKSIGFKGADGTQTDLYSALMNCDNLSDVQKLRLIDTACQIRNHYAELKQQDGLSNKASRSWLYHQAALAEVFIDLAEANNLGKPPEPKTLENDCLLAMFSQFRTHKYGAGTASMLGDRSDAMHEILSKSYPQKHIEQLQNDLDELSLASHPTDLISFDKGTVDSLTAAVAPRESVGWRARLDPSKVNYDFELGELSDRFSHVFFDSKDRLNRIDNLLNDFVSSNRVGTEKKALFFQQLNRLLRENDNAKLSLSSRADLAEQVLNHAHDLTSIDQGANKTCNVTTIENRIYSRQPEEIARMIAELAETGRYTTNSGRQIKLSNSLTGMKPDVEARASLRMQANGNNPIKRDGARDWASQLVQTTMVKILHEGDSKLLVGDEMVTDKRLAYDRQGNLLGLSDNTALEKFFDEKGKPIDEIKPGTKLFKKDGIYLQEVNPATVIYDERGNPCSTLSDQNKLQCLYDQHGMPVKNLEAGTICFDADGNFALYQSIPGEVTYDKILSKPRVEFRPETCDELERISVLHFGKRIFLRELKHDNKIEKISSPCLGSSTYRTICQEVTGVENSPFSIMRDTKAGTYFSTVYVDSIDELEKTLLKFQSEDNLPGILVVNTRQTPEKDNPFASKNPDAQGGAHVVNVHSYDPLRRLLRITNQWGSSYNFMDHGIELEAVYKGMNF